MSDTDIVKLTWKGEEFTLTRGEFNKAEVLKLPDGTLLNTRRMAVESSGSWSPTYNIRWLDSDPVMKVQEITRIREAVIN